MLTIRPISIKTANDFVEMNHRHHGKKTGCRFAIGCFEGETMCGVAICANPVARNADDGLTLEVSRVCTDGTYNACSILYGAGEICGCDVCIKAVDAWDYVEGDE